jgi:hypothetical protein
MRARPIRAPLERIAARTFRGIACAFALAAFLAAPAATQAADESGRFAVKGAGAVPCSLYTEARTRRLTDRLATFEGWLHGYTTGYNRFEAQTFDVVAWQGNSLLLAALDRYCKENPQQRFETAVAGLMNGLKPDRIVAQSESVVIKSGDTTMTLYKEVVVRIQKALTQRKLFAGKADGRYADDTKRAMEAFQKSQNLPTTGLPDRQTMFALFQPQPASSPSRTEPPAKPPAKPAPARPATPQRSSAP